MRQLPALSLAILSVVCFASLGSPGWAQLPPVKNPLIPSQNSPLAACSATDASSCAQVAAKLLPIVMGPSPMEENLRHLTDEIGGRVTGSPEMAQAVDWGVAAFRAANIDVHTEKYMLPVAWSEGDTRLEVHGPVKFPIRLRSTGWSPATPPGGIEAGVIDVGYGSEDDFATGSTPLKGAVLLVHTDIGSRWADLFDEYMRPPAIIDHALKSGAAAILWMGARERLLLYRHTNALNGQIDKIPQAVLAREDAMRLARTLAAYPGKVRIHFDMPNKIGAPVEQQNVVGEIRGREKPDEAVILGAHLDSWDLGTGSTDNGTGSMVVLEAARALQKLDLKPKRTIRFILFSGEEQGLNGSRAYVETHKADLSKFSGILVHDTGTGKVLSLGLQGNYQDRDTLDKALGPLHEVGVLEFSLRSMGGTDHLSFDQAGVPGFYAIQDPVDYNRTHHSQSDTFDRAREDDLIQGAQVLAIFAYNVAQLPDLLPRKPPEANATPGQR